MIRLLVVLTSLVTAGCIPAATDGDGEGEGDVGEGEGDVGEGEGDVGEGEGEGDIGEGEGEGEGEGDIGDRLTLIVDEASRVTTAVGAEGGSLAIGGNLLVVPANALAETLTISMALAEASELPGASLVALEPDGLVFLAPATLTLADARADAWVVRFDGDGVGPHLVPRARDATVTVEIGQPPRHCGVERAAEHGSGPHEGDGVA